MNGHERLRGNIYASWTKWNISMNNDSLVAWALFVKDSMTTCMKPFV